MQLINRSSIKKTLTHTWYIYPLTAIIISLLWFWGFQAYHQPTAHQIIKVFFATDVKTDSFLKKIRSNYDKEKLRETDYSYCLPTGIGYPSKLQIGVNEADILVLDEVTLNSFKDNEEHFFVEMTPFIKDNYLEGGETYYQFNEKDYGILLKEKATACWLNDYMDFDEERNYYLVLSIGSKNLGSITDEDNQYYDNALTFMKYLLKEH